MSTPKPPRRRWFQFSLRTMFVVVTVFAIWLGWELKFIRDRRVMRRWLNENNWEVTPAVNPPEAMALQDFSNITIPIWREWMGDEPVALITLPDNYSKVHEQSVRDLFQEATIVVQWRLVPSSDIDAERWEEMWQIVPPAPQL